MATETPRRVAPEGRPPRATKSRRLAIRLTDEVGVQLDRALAIVGRTQTDFITEAIAEKATAVVGEQRLLELTDRDMEALTAAIDDPPAPTEAMLRSVARWRDRGAPW